MGADLVNVFRSGLFCTGSALICGAFSDDDDMDDTPLDDLVVLPNALAFADVGDDSEDADGLTADAAVRRPDKIFSDTSNALRLGSTDTALI